MHKVRTGGSSAHDEGGVVVLLVHAHGQDRWGGDSGNEAGGVERWKKPNYSYQFFYI